MDDPPGQDSGDAITDAWVQMSYAVQRILVEAGEPEGLSVTQLRLLGVLRDRRLKVLQVAAVLGLEKSSASGLIDRAERRGLLERRASHDDARAVLVTLSPAGHQLAARVQRTVRDRITTLLQALSPEQSAGMATMLEQVLAAQSLSHPIEQ